MSRHAFSASGHSKYKILKETRRHKIEKAQGMYEYSIGTEDRTQIAYPDEVVQKNPAIKVFSELLRCLDTESEWNIDIEIFLSNL